MVRQLRRREKNFNPRSPWGERRQDRSHNSAGKHFNPRSPWGERRLSAIVIQMRLRFQSTLPVGGATANLYKKAEINCTDLQNSAEGYDTKERNLRIFVPRQPESTVNFSANLPEKLCLLGLRTSNNHGLLREISCSAAKMLDLVFVAFPQIVKAQTIPLWIHDTQQLGLQ